MAELSLSFFLTIEEKSEEGRLPPYFKKREENGMEFEKFLESENAVQAYFGENLRLTVSNVLKNNGVTLSGLIFYVRGQRSGLHHLSERFL